jgi:hypothetical protein
MSGTAHDVDEASLHRVGDHQTVQVVKYVPNFNIRLAQQQHHYKINCVKPT